MHPGLGILLLAGALATGCAGETAQASPAEIERGGELYATNGCGTCHGASGRGDGPMARTLNPPPRDFRDAAAFKNGTDPSSVASTIATGLTRDGGQMQSYFHLSDRERYLLARFVISLRDSADESVAIQQTPAVRVTGAWVREPVPGRGLAAAYAVIENTSPRDVQLVGVQADVAGTVELHEMVRSGDVMKMAPVKAVPIPRASRVELAPGGLHLMLFNLKRALKDGDSAAFTFAFSDGGTIRTAAPVRRGMP